MLLRRLITAGAASCALLLGVRALGADEPDAVIMVTSANPGASIGSLVQGRMRFRDQDYLLTLHGVAESVNSRGSVFGMQRARDISGAFRPAGDVLKNVSGVTIRFEPPLVLREGRLDVEITGLLQPKNTPGQPGSGVP